MEWLQFLIVTMTIGSFLWMARSDYRHLDAKIDSMKDLVNAIHLEMKDFHNRLCVIEKERKEK
jgi:hypothetical protein